MVIHRERNRVTRARTSDARTDNSIIRKKLRGSRARDGVFAIRNAAESMARRRTTRSLAITRAHGKKRHDTITAAANHIYLRSDANIRDHWTRQRDAVDGFASNRVALAYAIQSICYMIDDDDDDKEQVTTNVRSDAMLDR